MFNWLYGSVLAAKADRLGTYAAALAYCLVLSLIPFLVVTFTVATELTHESLVTAYSELLAEILPSENPMEATQVPEEKNRPLTEEERQQRTERAANISAQILKTLQRSSRGGLATVGFLFALYTSFNLMNQIVRTLAFIFDDARRAHEWSWLMVTKTIALLVIWMFLLFIFAISAVVGPVIEKMLSDAGLNPDKWTTTYLWVRDLVGIAFLFGAFFLTYLMVPTKRYRLSQVRNGSLVASLGWVICSLLFSYVLPNMYRTNAVYEALGSIVIILLWSQACAWSVIIGACCMVRFPGGRRK